MSQDVTFPKGLWISRRDDAPQFVIADISVELDEFIKFAKDNAIGGKLSMNLLVSKGGKPYARIDDYKMKRAKEQLDAEGGEQVPEAPSFNEPPTPTPVQPSFQPVAEPQTDNQVPF